MKMIVRESPLGADVMIDDRPVTLYRTRDDVARWESPKPCFAPIYTPSGRQLAEYRPWDHLWHTGLFFGWVHANESNLWGGAWYTPETGKYERVETHGIQRHDWFNELSATAADGIRIDHDLSWLDAADEVFATEQRVWEIELIDNNALDEGYRWNVTTTIRPAGDKPLVLGATRAPAHYSGLVLRMGPDFGATDEPDAESKAYDSQGRRGHEQIMGQTAKWVAAEGAKGGMVAIFDHPQNPRHPSTWFCRANLLGPSLLAPGDLEVGIGQLLTLRYQLVICDDPWTHSSLQAEFDRFASS